MAVPARMFTVACCETRRGILPGGVLVCPTCDYAHGNASVIPNENAARDVPAGFGSWHPTWGQTR